MNKEVIQNRQDLRLKLLIELYEHYYNPENKSKERYLKIGVSSLQSDNEKELAYTYLISKGFVKNQGANGIFALIITVDGMDYLENKYVN